MKVITTLEELDQKLVELDHAAAVSDVELRRAFNTFRMDPPVAQSIDPDSAPYRDTQFALYRTIAGKDYATENEKTPFDPIAMAAKPVPYLNDGWETTGDCLMAIGWIFKALKLPKGASVLEFGPGWGQTTLAMARNGYNVTAIEIEPNFVELIYEQARRIPVDVEVIKGDFLEAEKLDRQFDCVLFFECFHHCSRHNALFDLLDTLVADGGQVAFAAEPIDENFPAPWGVRLDGQSLWAIRKHGWLELGFTESYFVRSLMQRDWVVTKHVLSQCALGVVYTARRAKKSWSLATFHMAPDEDRTWGEPEHDPNLQQRYAIGDSKLTITREAHASAVAIQLVNTAPLPLNVTLSHGRYTQRLRVPANTALMHRVTYDRDGCQLGIASDVWKPSEVLGSGDHRTIGVGVRTITLE